MATKENSKAKPETTKAAAEDAKVVKAAQAAPEATKPAKETKAVASQEEKVAKDSKESKVDKDTKETSSKNKGTKCDVLDMKGKKVSTIQLAEEVFGLKPNERAMHAAIVNFLANQRQGTQSTKTRAEVRGGGRKPWRQKGTGHARQGSTRSPQWTHGGVALGPKPRDYSYRINRKVRRLALLSALSAKMANGDIVVVDKIEVKDYKTKTVINMLKALEASKKALIVTDEVDTVLVKSAANIPGVKTTIAALINVYDVLNAGKFVISVDAVKKIEEVFA